MKYLKLYENLTNYKIEVLTSEEFNKLYFKIYPRQTNLKDKIHYFDWHFDNDFGDKKQINSRLITYYKNPSRLAYADGVYENFVESLKNFIKDTNIKVIGYGNNFVEIDSKKIKWNNTEININLL